MTLNSFNTNSYINRFDWNSMGNFNNMNWSGAMGMNPGFTVPMAPNGGMDFSNFWNNVSVGAGSTTSSSSESNGTKKEMTFEEKIKFQEEHKTEIEQAKKYVEEQEKLYAEAKKAEVAEDGSLQVKESKEAFKKLGFWGRLGRGLVRTGEGVLKTGMDMIGVDLDLDLTTPPFIKGVKFNKEKFVKAAIGFGVAVAAIAITPYAAPVLLTLGAVSGGTMLAKGAYTAATTDDPEKFDKACQDIGGGAAIMAMSMCGVRRMSGAAEKSAFSYFNPLKWGKGLVNGIKTLIAEGPFKGSATIGKNIINGSTNNIVGAFSKAKVAQTRQNAMWKAGDIKGVLKENLNGLINVEGKQNSVTAKITETSSKLNRQLADVNSELTRLNGITGRARTAEEEAMFHILSEQKGILESQITKIASNDGATWRSLKFEKINNNTTWRNRQFLKLKYTCNKDIKINGKDFTRLELKPTEFNKYMAFKKQNAANAKELKELANAKQNLLRRMSFDRRYATEAQEYTSKDSFYGQVFETFRPHFGYHGVGKTLQSTAGFIFNDLMMLGFKPWLWFGKHPLSSGYKLEQGYRAITGTQEEDNMFGGMLGWGKKPMQVPTGEADQAGNPGFRAANKDDIETYYAQNVKNAKKIRDDLYNGIMPATQESAAKAAAEAAEVEAAKKELNLTA